MDEAEQQMGVVPSCAQGGRPGMGLFLALSLRCDWTKVWLLRLSRLLDGFRPPTLVLARGDGVWACGARTGSSTLHLSTAYIHHGDASGPHSKARSRFQPSV